MATAEIIAIGSELLTPEKTDTNSLWLTARLNEIGVEIKLKTIVGDDRALLETAIRGAMSRSDLVLMTGGLGPTEDDITREVSAKALDKTLVYHEALEADLRERFKRWGREMPLINKRQAFVIDGAEILPNPHGSAVGMLYNSENRKLVILPGPPRENQPMFTDFVLPRLRAIATDYVVRRRLLRVSGMGESAVDEIVAPIYTKYPSVDTSILFNKMEIELVLTAKAETAEIAEKTLEQLAAQIKNALGIAVFSDNGETMEEIVGKLLRSKGKTLAVAESCTGGLIGHRLTEIAGSSQYFIEGAITYANDAKIRALGVPSEIIDNFGAVSSKTAEAMAKGMRGVAGTDFAISVTGIAGPGGGSEEKPVGTIFIGYADENGTKSMKILLPGDRFLIRWRASQAALDYLRRQILKKGEGI